MILINKSFLKNDAETFCLRETLKH